MKNLKKLRLEKGLSQQQLAEYLHITQQSVYKYEKGISEPNTELMVHMADFFGTSVDYLIGRSSSPDHVMVSCEQLTPRELQHLYMYRQLHPEMKSAVDTIISECVKESQN